MDIFQFVRKGAPLGPTDELLYEFVAREIANTAPKTGLWTKALADCDWDEARAKALYVKMRVAQLKHQLEDAIERDQQRNADPSMHAVACGLSQEDIEYLGTPIEAVRYVKKYGRSKEKLAKAIEQGRIRGVIFRGVLWVQDKKYA